MLRSALLLLVFAASCLTLSISSVRAQPAWEAPEVAAPGEVAEPETSAPERSSDPEPERPAASVPMGLHVPDLDERLQTLATYLQDIQAPLRAFTAGWISLNAGIVGYSAWQATETDSGVRASHIMRATVSGLSVLLLAVRPMPGRSAWQKFKKLPDGTLEEKQAKLDQGVRWLAAQVNADKVATEPAAHVLVGLVALGCGAGLLFGYEDGMRPAVETTLGILLVGELQLATRPRRTRRYNRDLAAPPRPAAELSIAPWATPTSRGLALMGRF